MKSTAVKAAKEAGKILISNFKKIQNITKKPKGDYVTNVDLMSEKKIIGIIQKKISRTQHTL